MSPPEGKTVRRERWVARGIIAALVALGLYGLAHTESACTLMWRASRGGALERSALRWMLRCHGLPIERELAAGAIRPGDSVDELVARRPPERIDTYGPYQRLRYYPPLTIGGGPCIIAKDGRVTSAASRDCTWMLVFFDTLTATERQECSDIMDAELNARRAGEVAKRIAIIGGIGALGPWELKPPEPPTDE